MNPITGLSVATKNCGRDFDAAPKVSPKEVDGHARRDAREQPDVVE
jgi:hypothetical protein